MTRKYHRQTGTLTKALGIQFKAMQTALIKMIYY